MPAITDLPIQNELGYEIKTQGTTDTTPTTYTYSGSLNGYIFRNDGGVNITFKVNSNAAVTVAPGEVVNGLIPISSFTINAASGVASWTMRAFELLNSTNTTSSLTFQSGATAIGNGTANDVSGYDVLALQVTISATASVTFETTVDGTTWSALQGYTPTSLGQQSSTVGTGGIYRFIVTGMKLFRARISSYTSGTIDVTGYAVKGTFQIPVLTNSYGNADGQSATSLLQGTGSYLLGYNGTNWDRIRTGSLTGALRSMIYGYTGNSADVWLTSADAVASSYAVATYTYPYLYNGTTFDRQRNNFSATGLSSAARTASTSTADITNYNHRGIIISLNVTAASGTGGLQVTVQAKDSLASVYKSINTAPTAVTAAGQYIYMIYPGIDTVSSNNAQNVSQVLPQTFRFNITAGDASSYTYSITYQLIV